MATGSDAAAHQVRDLLTPTRLAPAGGLRVREDPTRGPYVEGLTVRPVPNFRAFCTVLEEGTRERTVAATACNAASSRAHTIVQLTVSRSSPGPGGELCERVSKVDLVDLAGSERAAATGARGRRLEEGAAINRSLSSLGNCIRALSDAQAKSKRPPPPTPAPNTGALVPAVPAPPPPPAHIPFRDSVLTWLLKNSLGGNAKTALIAAVSPSQADHDETLSTLRFADRMQRVETAAVVNEGRRVQWSAGKEGKEGEDGAGRGSHESGGLSVGGARGSLTPPRSVSNSSGAGLKASSPATAAAAAAAAAQQSVHGVPAPTLAALKHWKHRRAAMGGNIPHGGSEAPAGPPGSEAGAASSAAPLARVAWGASGRIIVSAAPSPPAQQQPAMPPAARRVSPPLKRSPSAAALLVSAARSRRIPPPRRCPAPGGEAGAQQGGAAVSPTRRSPALQAPAPAPAPAPQPQPLPQPPPRPAPAPPPPRRPQAQSLRPAPLQLPQEVDLAQGSWASPPPPSPLWTLPPYPQTPAVATLPDGDSPSNHAWAPLPPADGELPRWDVPITPVLRASANGALPFPTAVVAQSPAAAAAAAAAMVAAVELERRSSGGQLASPGGSRLSASYLACLEKELHLGHGASGGRSQKPMITH